MSSVAARSHGESHSNNVRAFRKALGSFATGVTIVTTADSGGRPVGVTASSFNSVSLDPPLVLWSLAKSATSLAAFQQNAEFAIHVLSSKQTALSNRFAMRGVDKFEGVDWRPGPTGVPLLAEFAARFRCRTAHQYEGGDHIIFVGEVLDFEHRAEAPLLFHGGAYAEARARVDAPATSGVDLERGRITDDFLLFLLTRAQFQVIQPITELRVSLDMPREEQMSLLLLGMNGALSVQDLRARLAFTGMAPGAENVAHMLERAWVMPVGDALQLAPAGQDFFLEMLARGKAFEDRLLEHFTAQEVDEARRFLQKLIQLTAHGMPDLWE